MLLKKGQHGSNKVEKPACHFHPRKFTLYIGIFKSQKSYFVTRLFC